MVSFFCCKQKTAYEMRISDWSSDVCSSDLPVLLHHAAGQPRHDSADRDHSVRHAFKANDGFPRGHGDSPMLRNESEAIQPIEIDIAFAPAGIAIDSDGRSEEHTSELQSLMRISYAVFCLKKKTHAEPTPI